MQFFSFASAQRRRLLISLQARPPKGAFAHQSVTRLNRYRNAYKVEATGETRRADCRLECITFGSGIVPAAGLLALALGGCLPASTFALPVSPMGRHMTAALPGFAAADRPLEVNRW